MAGAGADNSTYRQEREEAQDSVWSMASGLFDRILTVIPCGYGMCVFTFNVICMQLFIFSFYFSLINIGVSIITSINDSFLFN